MDGPTRALMAFGIGLRKPRRWVPRRGSLLNLALAGSPMRSMIWRLILISPLLLLLILFALSNTQSVRLGMWPTGISVEAPLSILILLAMAVAFLLGALSTWFVGLGARWRARRAEQSAGALRSELQAANARLVRDQERDRVRLQDRSSPTILPPAVQSRS